MSGSHLEAYFNCTNHMWEVYEHVLENRILVLKCETLGEALDYMNNLHIKAGDGISELPGNLRL